MKRGVLILALCAAAAAAAAAAIASAMDAARITTGDFDIVAGPRARAQAVTKDGARDAPTEIRVKLPERRHGDCWVVRVERSKRNPDMADITDGWPCGAASTSSGAGPPVDSGLRLD